VTGDFDGREGRHEKQTLTGGVVGEESPMVRDQIDVA
jgi:hypothetical protein